MFKYVSTLPLLFAFLTQPAYPQRRLAPASPPLPFQNIRAGQWAMENIPPDQLDQRLQRQLIARAIADRQAALKRDTEKLVALAAELKQHVEKADANTLSMDVIKKAKEIQKLAKSVQEKMRNAF